MCLTALSVYEQKQAAFVNGGAYAPFISTVDKCRLFLLSEKNYEFLKNFLKIGQNALSQDQYCMKGQRILKSF